MSLLERRAKPLLVPMIRGRGTSLTQPSSASLRPGPTEDDLLRRATRSSLVTGHDGARVQPGASAAESVLVLLGAFEGYGTGVGVHMPGASPPSPYRDASRCDPRQFGLWLPLHSGTGQHELCDWPIEMLAPSESCWVRCWPEWFPFTNLRWPPPVVIGRDSWWTIA